MSNWTKHYVHFGTCYEKICVHYSFLGTRHYYMVKQLLLFQIFKISFKMPSFENGEYEVLIIFWHCLVTISQSANYFSKMGNNYWGPIINVDWVECFCSRQHLVDRVWIWTCNETNMKRAMYHCALGNNVSLI